ncbi:ABC transporter permease subunit [Aliishimia ponticola]|uniref:ABC transporter permease subunit n=1 Tax=Aliishimia ponticola TaxID=2499833 RepID=A0A4S4N7F3_9RHOB|nr:ABC transporter permease subunit [Aliishimia ponticola]THH34465.1 ABC transporter permease subunit [Aliishimia ponticola]
MATLTDPPQESFQLSMLLNDTRYRSYTFQFIALIVLIAIMAYLMSNLFANLRAAGLNISYGFLTDPAGYDINQRLIEYDSQSTHLRAALVGILNTLLVASMACVTATILGVIAGVLRLSKNWLVSKLMAFYVEAFRNVPVFIWILMIGTFVTLSGDAPKAFLGENPSREMFLGGFAFTNRGLYMPAVTAGAGAGIVVLVFLASIVAAFWWRSHVKKTLFKTGKLLPAWVFWPILIVPAILAQLVLGSPLGLIAPDTMANRFNIQGGLLLGKPLIALWLALSVYTGAFIAENVRAGIQAVNRGQTEAAASLGLRPGRIMNLVVLPQALRVIIPPLISQYLNITKNSSLAIAVGYADITATLGGITLNQTGRAIECVLLLMLFYLTISLLISAVMNVYNKSVSLKER